MLMDTSAKREPVERKAPCMRPYYLLDHVERKDK